MCKAKEFIATGTDSIMTLSSDAMSVATFIDMILASVEALQIMLRYHAICLSYYYFVNKYNVYTYIYRIIIIYDLFIFRKDRCKAIFLNIAALGQSKVY